MLPSLVLVLASAALAAASRCKPRTTVQFMGTNIAGFDFGTDTSGNVVMSSVTPPLTSLGGCDGAGQMSHFVKDDGFNLFRLPVSWQYLVNSVEGGDLDSTNFGKYDELVQECLSTGAHCIVDIHNYARWNGAIIGQGGPTNAQFAGLWSQLATKYANSSNVIFGLMNEPHDLDIDIWAVTVQAAVTAIRQVATSQMILLPGTSYTSVSVMASVSGPALLDVKNPDGTTTGLIFDVHQYLDSDSSGTNAECVTDAYTQFQSLATWLRTNGRQALTTETGGGNTASCITDVCKLVSYLNSNADVFLGMTSWAAGSFDANSYALADTPTKSGETWTDSALVKACLIRS